MTTTIKMISRCMLCALVVSPAFAQDDQGDESSEVYELSPFVVDASQDQGYYATNTLAGTRLNSSLKDVAAPVSVYTKDLMTDVGATDVQDILEYSVNVQNENEFAPDDTEGESISTTVQTRVRGLSAGTPTRGYFKTKYRTDAYNTQRVTVARGPNSILFGLGNPGGVIDSTPSKASFDRFFGEVSARVDNWGSVRGSLDFNVPLISDMLAVRVAGMEQEKKTFREPELDDESRRYAALSFRPFKNTTIHANYEKMKMDRVRARVEVVPDRVSDWIALGKPLYDHSTGLWSSKDGSTWEDRPELDAWVKDYSIGNTSPSRVFIADGGIGDVDSYQGMSWLNTGLSYDVDKTLLVEPTFSNDDLVDPTINYHGSTSLSFLEGDTSSVVLQQKIVNNLHVELAYNKENYHRNQHEMMRPGMAAISADVNYYLPYPLLDTTTPGNVTFDTSAPLVMNPNRGRYMIESQYIGYQEDFTMETYRAMVTYNLDFNDYDLEWLGRHSFGLMYQKEESDRFRVKRRLENQGEYWLPWHQNKTHGRNFAANNVTARYYLNLDGDTAGVDYPGEFTLPSWPTMVGGFGGDGRPQHTLKEVEGVLFVMQNHLLKDNLVLTFGYRDDTQSVWEGDFSRDGDSLAWDLETTGFSETAVEQSGITRTYGVVYHTPWDGVSLTYNRANTINPQGEFRDWYENPVPAGSGEGEDIGVNLSLLNGKLNAKLSYYESTSIDAIEVDWYYEEPKWSVVGLMDASWASVVQIANRMGQGEDFAYNPWIRDAIRATRDYESKGIELELFYKPTRNLDIRWTLAQVKAENIRVVPLLQEYVAERYPVWEKYFEYDATTAWWWNLDWGPHPTLDDWQTNPDSIGYQLLVPPAALPRVDEFAASEGSVTKRGRKWRSNLIVNYRFDEKLEGFSLGGALRYRSPAVVGYHGMDNPRLPSAPQVSDVTKPIEGDEIFDIDVWAKYQRDIKLFGSDMTWVVQLNVRNLFTSEGSLTPTQAYTDGSYVRYEAKAPRTYAITNTLKF